MTACSCGADLGGELVDGYLHGAGVCRRAEPLFQLPQAFVDIGATDVQVVPDDVALTAAAETRAFELNKVSYSIPMSRTMLLDYGMILPTPAERIARAAALAASKARTAAERVTPWPRAHPRRPAGPPRLVAGVRRPPAAPGLPLLAARLRPVALLVGRRARLHR